MYLLETQHLQAFYGNAQILKGISLVIEEGNIVSIIGPNGAGKTTALRALCGLVDIKGEVYFQGQHINGMHTEDITRLGIAYVPEEYSVFNTMSVEENLRLGAVTRHDKKDIAEDIEKVFEYFPILKERRKEQAKNLSGGEQKMLSISRALMLRPRLILLDEPSFSLAPLIIKQVFNIVEIINKERKVTVLFTEQNVKLALQLAKYAYVLEDGNISIEGDASTLEKSKFIQKAYLG